MKGIFMLSITKNHGRYNWLSNDEQWLVVIMLPGGRQLSETFPDDEEPEISGLPPSEVVELLADRAKRYLLDTEREKKKEIVAWCREHADEIDSEWAKGQIALKQKRIEALKAEIAKLEDIVEDVAQAEA